MYNKVASKTQARKGEARGSCNKNYDDFLIKQEKRQQNTAQQKQQ